MGKLGFVLFLVINSSFIFLILSPYIPNLIGQYRDQQLLEGCDERIQQLRMGPVQIQIRNESTGLPIPGWTVSYQHVQHEFVFGCNCFYWGTFSPSNDELYNSYFKRLFNLAVVSFHWPNYEPEEGMFPTEARINSTLTWCLENNITPKGHPIIWTRANGLPDWLLEKNDSEQIEILKNRITTLLTKYQGVIQDWEVVIEPIHTVSYANMSRLDYVYNSYMWTNASNPNAQLTINNYGILGHDFGYGPYFNLIEDLIALDTPFDVIGMESHEPRTDWIPATEIWRTLDAYADFDKPIHITEFTPTSVAVPITNSWKKGVWSEENQAEYARRFYRLCFSHPACEAIIWWDLVDSKSWIEGGGLLNSSMDPKPAYNVLDQLINQEWRTAGSKMTNTTGWIDFVGYYGRYNISVPNGKYQLIDIESGAENNFIIEI